MYERKTIQTAALICQGLLVINTRQPCHLILVIFLNNPIKESLYGKEKKSN